MNKGAYDRIWGTTLRTTTALHRVVQKVSGGRVWTRFPGGGQVVWITTLGRKSGQWRTNPLLAVRDGDAWVVTGSNAGQAKVPGWVFNARDHADGWVQVGRQAWSARFDEAEGADRDALYERLTKIWKSYSMYADNAGRYIPVFRVRMLQPVPLSAIPSGSR